jgi:hypothetical protein
MYDEYTWATVSLFCFYFCIGVHRQADAGSLEVFLIKDARLPV